MLYTNEYGYVYLAPCDLDVADFVDIIGGPETTQNYLGNI